MSGTGQEVFMLGFRSYLKTITLKPAMKSREKWGFGKRLREA
jgi:hypothetical protein